MWYHLSYDVVNGDNDDYDNLFEYIDTFPAYAHILKSSWVIKSSKKAYVIRDEINAITTSNVRVLITEMDEGERAASLKNNDIDYLVNNLGWRSP